MSEKLPKLNNSFRDMIASYLYQQYGFIKLTNETDQEFVERIAESVMKTRWNGDESNDEPKWTTGFNDE